MCGLWYRHRVSGVGLGSLTRSIPNDHNSLLRRKSQRHILRSNANSPMSTSRRHLLPRPQRRLLQNLLRLQLPIHRRPRHLPQHPQHHVLHVRMRFQQRLPRHLLRLQRDSLHPRLPRQNSHDIRHRKLHTHLPSRLGLPGLGHPQQALPRPPRRLRHDQSQLHLHHPLSPRLHDLVPHHRPRRQSLPLRVLCNISEQLHRSIPGVLPRRDVHVRGVAHPSRGRYPRAKVGESALRLARGHAGWDEYVGRGGFVGQDEFLRGV
ncbi:hypothetical protein KVT40_002767 [Elsinoe batatas]|uniref:Uncharacterized protein n=1 Tax=Elsinoe batatas TaxID=2601811 RepID=A0A8K0L4M6_9PEZI|nr:hypothetical protein KVT40_002767 [Elsinoe batatas]